MNNKKPVIKKIKFTKEQQEEIDHILKGEPVKKTRLVKNGMRGYSYDFTTNRPISKDMIKKRLTQLYGGLCTGCGYVWPDYRVTYQVGDEQQPATLVRRYCSPCLEKWKDKL